MSKASYPGNAGASRRTAAPESPLQGQTLTLPGFEPAPPKRQRVNNGKPRDAYVFQEHYLLLLRRLGFYVQAEVPCPVLNKDGTRRDGRIDLVASKGDCVVAYELDAKRPRLNSINKLMAFACTEAWVVCRTSGIIERVK